MSVNARKILFAVGSEGGIARSAIDKAVHLASAMKAELELFHCAFDSDIAHASRFNSRAVEVEIREFVEQRQNQLHLAAESLEATGVSVCSSVCWDHPVHEGIVREVLRIEPDLLIVESTRKSRAERLMLTQTDHKLIETCPCPLLLIRTSRSYWHPRVVAAVDPMHAHDKPAALDDAILTTAAEVSTGLSGQLLMFHARIAQIAYENSVETRLEELARRHSLTSNHIRIVDGDVTQSLPAFVHAESVGILVMGALSRSLPKRMLIGQTARRLLDAVDCDVLVVKQTEAESTVSP
jgi:universal stress protein E